MPIQIDVSNGNVSGGRLTWGCNFEWVNPTGNLAILNCCGAFCTQTSYSVPAATGPGQPGITPAQLLMGFQMVFGDSAWTAPGMPHIVVPPAEDEDDDDRGEHRRHRDHEKEVA